MLTAREIISACFLFAGLFFGVTTAIGIIRLPDFYSRCHTSGNSETIGLLLSCIGFVIYAGFSMLSVKILILFFFVCACNPIGTHILSRAAYQTGYKMTEAEGKGDAHADTHR